MCSLIVKTVFILYMYMCTASFVYSVLVAYEKLAIEGSMDPTTKQVTLHILKWKGISYNIYDTQGLQDGKEDDSVYLTEIKLNVQQSI